MASPASKLSGVTWGYCKGVRGYFEWHRGHVRFKPVNYAPKRKSDGIQIIKDIEPFQNIAIDNGIVGGRKQRRDMMRAHGLTEVGNERPMEHPRDIADRKRDRPDRSIIESLKRHSGGKWL